jgi:hypothetical protein
MQSYLKVGKATTQAYEVEPLGMAGFRLQNLQRLQNTIVRQDPGNGHLYHHDDAYRTQVYTVN